MGEVITKRLRFNWYIECVCFRNHRYYTTKIMIAIRLMSYLKKNMNLSRYVDFLLFVVLSALTIFRFDTWSYPKVTGMVLWVAQIFIKYSLSIYSYLLLFLFEFFGLFIIIDCHFQSFLLVVLYFSRILAHCIVDFFFFKEYPMECIHQRIQTTNYDVSHT